MNTPQMTCYNDELAISTIEKGTLKELNRGALYAGDDVFGTVAKSSNFLPRLQLFTSANNECKAGRIAMNHYGLVVSKDKITVIGKTVDVVPLSWRPKAMQIMADGTIITTYDTKDSEFKRIAQASDVQNSGCMFGVEFLLWVPVLKRFATFYMASKSARNEASNLKDKLDDEKPATLDSHFIETKKFSWQAPLIRGCSTPLEYPEMAMLVEETNKFNNPPKNETEAVEPETRAR